MVLPAFAVPGIGAVVSPVPPFSEVYHNRLSPVAVNAVAVSSTQYSTGELLAVGATGRSLTVTVAISDNEMLQFPLDTSFKVKVVFELTPFTGTVAFPPAGMVTVLVDVPSL